MGLLGILNTILPTAAKFISDKDKLAEFQNEVLNNAHEYEMKELDVIEGINKNQTEQNRETIIHWLARPMLFMGMTILFLT